MDIAKIRDFVRKFIKKYCVFSINFKEIFIHHFPVSFMQIIENNGIIETHVYILVVVHVLI